MEAHYQLSDNRFERQFRMLTLSPKWFTHEAHLRLAWIHLQEGNLEQVETKVCEQIAVFDRTFGDGTKFHKTLTIAAVKGVHHFLQGAKSNNFKGFIEEFPDLKYRFKELLATHYSWNILEDQLAKIAFIEPDLEGF